MNFKKIICFILSMTVLMVSATGCKEETQSKPKKKVVVVVTNKDKNESNVESDEENTDSNVEYDDENTDLDVEFDDENTESDDSTGESDENDATDETLERVKRELFKTETTGKVETLPVEYKKAVAAWEGPKGYVIIVPANDDTVKHSAELLKEYFSKKAGVKLSIKEDTQKSTAKEILVGKTNRNVSTTKYKEGEYAVKLYDKKLSFEGGHWNSVENAAKSFVSLPYISGKVNTLTGSTDFVSDKNGYKFVWGDDFSGDTLDFTKWSFSTDTLSSFNNVKFCDDPRVLNVSDGKLELNAMHYYNPVEPQYEFAAPVVVNTRKGMTFKYGYLEMRAKVPFDTFSWPAFWMNNDKNEVGPAHIYDYMTEIDIFEIFGSKNRVVPCVHKWYNKSIGGGPGSLPKAYTNYYDFADYENLNNEYHIYGFEWTPDEMSMIVDGEKYMTINLSFNYDNKSDMSGFHDAQAILLQHNVYAENSHVNLPNEFHIDYVRLYQKSNGAIYTK